jgi:hypothetical protein
MSQVKRKGSIENSRTVYYFKENGELSKHQFHVITSHSKPEPHPYSLTLTTAPPSILILITPNLMILKLLVLLLLFLILIAARVPPTVAFAGDRNI